MNKKKGIDVVIGMGEIGKGLYTVIRNSGQTVFGLDIETDDGGKNPVLGIKDMGDSGADYLNKYNLYLSQIEKHTSIMHICIPGELPDFESVVAEYIERFSPEVTIVHSTVPVGTTAKLNKYGVVLHSPVRGKHPKMDEGILNYVKYIGVPKDTPLKIWELVNKKFNKYGIRARYMTSSEASELAKLLSTTRYGVNLLFADMQKELIESYGLEYLEVVTEWEQTYNEGLQRVGQQRYRRPILSPPNGYIGGHCVYENAGILLKKGKPLSKINIFLRAIKDFGRIGDKNEE